jgi:coenzyme F420-0:L-glutamate ligase/coenzyme F420-1:gamma-L-glutamate ligase
MINISVTLVTRLHMLVWRTTSLAKTVSIVGLEGFPLVKKGDSLADLIVSVAKKERVALSDGDIIVVTHKIVSKAEGRIVKLRDVTPSAKAQQISEATQRDPRLVELVLKESKRVVKASSQILIVENRQGFICINAGVDKSNVQGSDAYALLPLNSDASARRIRNEIKKSTGKNIGVIICDTYSRPMRRGQVQFAVGAAGVSLFRDYRGKKDLFGYVLKVKNSAIADEIASAAELLMGQGKEGIPAVIVKGLKGVKTNQDTSIGDLIMPQQEDLFKGTLA